MRRAIPRSEKSVGARRNDETLPTSGDISLSFQMSRNQCADCELIFDAFITNTDNCRPRQQDTAPVAQLDRVLGYEPSGREFESLQARHI